MRHREPKSLARMFDKRNRTPWRSRAQSRYDGSGKVSIGHAGWPALEKMAELVNARRYGGRVGNERGGRYSGRFWLPLQETEHVGGWLDLSGARPILELAEPLTPALREASRTASPDGSVSTQWQLADDDLQPAGLTVHGILRGAASRRVTLVGAITVGRQQAGGPVRDPGEQRLRAEYVLLGGHRTGADAGARGGDGGGARAGRSAGPRQHGRGHNAHGSRSFRGPNRGTPPGSSGGHDP